jgi:uncharacterized protein YndB with AHSA1/START domain
MAVTDVRKDLEALTMFVDSEFDAPPERIWQLWEDPRQLERWWGPPTYPATFDKHTGLVPGAFIAYHMTGPEGDQPRGWWEVLEVDPPHRLVIRDGFADESGDKNPELPDGLMRVSIDDIGGGRTRMTIANIFPSLEAMEQLLAMGQEEGMKQAVNQIDGILAENKAGALA